MRKIGTAAILWSFAFLLGAAPAAAQAWDAPMFLPPHPGEDLGIYLSKPDNADWGLQGIWRQQGNLNLGVRLGFAQINSGNTSWFLGAETYAPIVSGPSTPLDVSWVLGAGASFDGALTWFRLPFGVTVGKTLHAGRTAITPYVLPRLALDVESVDNATDTRLNFATDLGVDLRLSPAVKLRFAATLEADSRRSFQNLGLGLAFAFGRSTQVR